MSDDNTSQDNADYSDNEGIKMMLKDLKNTE